MWIMKLFINYDIDYYTDYDISYQWLSLGICV